MAEDQLSRTFAALADPTRRAILGRLSEGPASVGELAEPFEITAQAVSKHLKVLERAGLISRGRQAQRRPSQVNVAPLDEVAEWIERYRAVWHDRLNRLDREIQRVHRAARTAEQEE